MNLKELIKSQHHPFHIVFSSPWPFFISCILFSIIISTIHNLTNNVSESIWLFFIKICLLCIFLTGWFYDIIIEATYEGYHTDAVQTNLRLGFSLFIVSEVMFFFGFFWAFFHACINPSIWIGEIWPPVHIIPLDVWNIPLLNTFILLTSGLAITWSHSLISSGSSFFELHPKVTIKLAIDSIQVVWFHHQLFIIMNILASNLINFQQVYLSKYNTFYYCPALILKFNCLFYSFLYQIISSIYFNLFCRWTILYGIFVKYFTNHFINCLSLTRYTSFFGFIYTILLGISFSLLQRYEYIHASFTIADGIYASSFYMLTGLHGLHVIIGTIFIIVCFIRHINYHFTIQHHLGLEAAIWYWHFVDVVWLFVFCSIYWFGGHY